MDEHLKRILPLPFCPGGCGCSGGNRRGRGGRRGRRRAWGRRKNGGARLGGRAAPGGPMLLCRSVRPSLSASVLRRTFIGGKEGLQPAGATRELRQGCRKAARAVEPNLGRDAAVHGTLLRRGKRARCFARPLRQHTPGFRPAIVEENVCSDGGVSAHSLKRMRVCTDTKVELSHSVDMSAHVASRRMPRAVARHQARGDTQRKRFHDTGKLLQHISPKIFLASLMRRKKRVFSSLRSFCDHGNWDSSLGAAGARRGERRCLRTSAPPALPQYNCGIGRRSMRVSSVTLRFCWRSRAPRIGRVRGWQVVTGSTDGPAPASALLNCTHIAQASIGTRAGSWLRQACTTQRYLNRYRGHRSARQARLNHP